MKSLSILATSHTGYLDKEKSEEYVAEMLSCDAPQVNSIRGATWDEWEKMKSSYIEDGSANGK